MLGSQESRHTAQRSAGTAISRGGLSLAGDGAESILVGSVPQVPGSDGGLRKVESYQGKLRSSPTRPRGWLFLCRGEHGGSLVEFALILPVFLTVLLGIFKFGIAFSNQLTLTQAVGVGAQYLQQIRTNTSDPCADTFAKIEAAAPFLTPSKIAVKVSMNGTNPSQTGHTCSGAQTNLVQGGAITVGATYPCDLVVYGINFANGCQLQAQVTEYEY